MRDKAAGQSPDPDELSVEAAVRANLADVEAKSPAHVALVALAISSARKLDEGAGLAHAAVARELRATLDVLTKGDDADDDDAAFSEFISDLRSPLGNPAFS